MKHFPSHRPNPNYSSEERDSDLAQNLGLAKNALLRQPWTGPDEAGCLFVRGSMARTIDDNPSARRFYSLGVDYNTAGYLSLMNPGVPVSFLFEGETLTTNPVPTHEALNPGAPHWMEAFSFAIALRRRDAIDVLARFPLDFRGDAFTSPLCKAYRAFILGESAWDSFAQQALDLAPLAKFEPPKLVARLTSIVPTMRAIAQRDREAYSDALIGMLRAHKAQLARGSSKDTGASATAELALGIAAFAYDHGLELDVDSDYLPRWLVLGLEPATSS